MIPVPKSSAVIIPAIIKKMTGSNTMIMIALNMVILCTLVNPTTRRFIDHNKEITAPKTGMQSKIDVL